MRELDKFQQTKRMLGMEIRSKTFMLLKNNAYIGNRLIAYICSAFLKSTEFGYGVWDNDFR